MGVVFGQDVDDLFVAARLPDGWSIESTSHPMWNNVLDKYRRVRGKYFYKGSFWDRDAHLNAPERRYTAGLNYGDEVPDGWVQGVVKDGDTVVWRTMAEEGIDSDVRQSHIERAERWLADNYPDHRDPLAYWND